MAALPDILEWSRRTDLNARPWLVLGKGPSYRKIHNVDTSKYSLLSLNHVVRERPVEVAHVIDLRVVLDCARAIYDNARVLLMPLHPHLDSRPGPTRLEQLVPEITVLKQLADEGRLYWYNASTWKDADPASPTIRVRFFSAEAAIGILATCGARTVRSLGVDGGASYAGEFGDLVGATLLANGHQSFDRQFEGIARTIRESGIFYAPLHVEAPVRVFVGTDRAQMLGVRLLEYSIKRFASLSVEVKPIDDTSVPVPKDPANRSRTGFSFSRFKIPELCGYRGRGIYVDADMQVFTDILELWNMPFDGASVLYADGPPEKGRIPQFSVMLMDCSSLDWDVRQIVQGFDEGQYTYGDLMQRLCILAPEKRRAGLPFEWNSLEHYEEGRTKLIHYTDMPTQPWVSHDNKNGERFYTALREALSEGFIRPEEVYEEVAIGNVSPDLPSWVGLEPPADVEVLRASWTPPYKRFVGMPKVAQKGGA
jgi:hypothetical protein